MKVKWVKYQRISKETWFEVCFSSCSKIHACLKNKKFWIVLIIYSKFQLLKLHIYQSVQNVRILNHYIHVQVLVQASAQYSIQITLAPCNHGNNINKTQLCHDHGDIDTFSNYTTSFRWKFFLRHFCIQ